MSQQRLFNRAVIRLSADADGEDLTGFLQGLVTNDLRGQLPAYAALLTPQGKTMFDFLVWPSGDDLLIDCEDAAADDLIKRLSLYRLRRKITIARDDTIGVFWQAELGDGGAADPRLGDLGQRWIAPITSEDRGADDAYLRHRLSLGVPEGRAEMADILWLETNAVELNGVSFEKGCYIGQENTARMNWRQKVNRRLVVVPFDRSEEKRRKAAYPELGYALDHLRVADINPAILPAWLSLDADSSQPD
ncbi:YgfZ/GcvT domain-containing protein [Altericroceibacterium endophyticum]|uniref:Folate-binding protein n=1 Tax=Altericroceibacterium endophyticum TaxID=1808508 RepID=A0A6I4T7Y4_9SPHN|nr:folate-binding protein YgfZ [Altericroceibacterium endophyticum]MXO66897.1 folate-binding protein [Altericroceibacterium endophyticum]